ncbi:hypothetical protein HZA98_03880 [Candidatus Woesearchaeota archaeon]|nr:hypothetical protein [Candidatus Woesearchaeota archaeon]
MHIKKIGSKFKEQTNLLIISALSLVAALAWNTAIQTFFEKYLSIPGEISAKFIYAILVTLLAVIIMLILKKK